MDKDGAIEILLEAIRRAVIRGLILSHDEQEAYDRLRKDYPR